MRLCNPRKPRKIGGIAVHAEHAFGNDDPGRRLASLLREQFLEVTEIVVPEADLPDPGGSAAVMETRVIQPVGKYRGARHCGEQGRQDRRVGLPARCEQQRGFGSLEGRDPTFDRKMRFTGAGYQTRRARSGAV